MFFFPKRAAGGAFACSLLKSQEQLRVDVDFPWAYEVVLDHSGLCTLGPVWRTTPSCSGVILSCSNVCLDILSDSVRKKKKWVVCGFLPQASVSHGLAVCWLPALCPFQAAHVAVQLFFFRHWRAAWCPRGAQRLHNMFSGGMCLSMLAH